MGCWVLGWADRAKSEGFPSSHIHPHYREAPRAAASTAINPYHRQQQRGLTELLHSSVWGGQQPASSQSQVKAAIGAVFWHCPRSPGAPASSSGRADPQEGLRCGLQRGVAGGDAVLLQGGMQAAAALEFSPRRCELIHSSKSSKIICGEYQFCV